MVPDLIANEVLSGSDSHLPLQQSVVPAGTTEQRLPTGQFAKGHSGNPLGRPVGRKSEIVQLKQEMEVAIRRHVKPEKLKKIVEKIANKAINGNVAAAKLIFDHFLSKANADEEDAGGKTGIRIVIENATFKAQAATPVQVVVDGEYQEVSK